MRGWPGTARPAASRSRRIDRISPGAPAGSARGPRSLGSCAELDERKVLGPVVVRAQGEPLQARVGVAELREHDDLHPHGLRRPPEMLEHLQAVEHRHPDIQQQQRGAWARTRPTASPPSHASHTLWPSRRKHSASKALRSASSSARTMVVVTFPGLSPNVCMASYQNTELANGPFRPGEGKADAPRAPNAPLHRHERTPPDPPFVRGGFGGAGLPQFPPLTKGGSGGVEAPSRS